MNSKSKYLILVVGIISLGLLLTGGTYAFLSYNATVTNATYTGNSTCFIIDYSDEVNTGGLPVSGDDVPEDDFHIGGYLFQSATPQNGLLTTVTLKIKDDCYVEGLQAKGTITLTVSTATNAKLIGDAHCEYANTGVYVDTVLKKNASSTTTISISSSATCVSDVTENDSPRVWVADDTTPALKYAVYVDDALVNDGIADSTGNGAGYVNKTGDIDLYTDFDITDELETYSIYIWLDGTVADNSYVNLPFDAYIHASAEQVES